MPSIASLVVKIGAQDAEITAALAKLGSNVKRTEAEFKKLGSTPVAQQAQQSLRTLDDTVKQITNSQQRLADRAKIAAAGLTALGGPARVTRSELEQINRTIQNGLDAYRALGQQAPKELQKVADAVSRQRKELAGGGKSGSSDLSGLLGSIGISTGLLTGAGVVAGLVTGSKAALDYADSLTKLSDRTGIGTVELQRLGAVAQASGNDIDQIASAVNQFQKRLLEDSDATTSALGRIGLTVEQLRSLSPDEQFFAIAKGIQSIQDPAEQTRTAMELFGKSGAEILPTLKADVDALKDSTVKMSAEAVKALDDFGDALGRISGNAISAIGSVFGETLAAIQAASEQAEKDSRANQFQAGFRTGDITLRPGATPPPGFDLQAKIAQTNAALAQSAAETATAQTEVTRTFEAAAQAAKRLADANQVVADRWRDIQDASKPYPQVLATINAGTRDTILNQAALGADVKDLGTAYGLTKGQIDAVASEMKMQALIAQASAAIHAKLATEVYNVDTAFGKLQGRGLTKIPSLQSGANPQLAALGTLFAQNFGDTLRTAIPQSISRAIEGGGSVIQAAGSTLGSFLVSEKGFGKQVSSGLTAIFGRGISDAISNLLPGIGALLGPLMGKIGSAIKDVFGGPSKRELEGRDAEAEFEGQFASFNDMVNRIGDAYAATGRSRAEAEIAVKALLDSERLGADAVAEAIDRLQGVLNEADQARSGASRYGLNRDELQQAAEDAKDTLDYMTRSNLYTQDQLNQAYYDWQKAMADAGDAAAKAWIATRDAVTSGGASASKAIDDLRAKRDGLTQSVENEVPEEVMGVIEAQIRGQIAALDAQLNAQQGAVDENTDQATVAADEITDAFKNCWTGVGNDGRAAADDIRDTFNNLDITVKVKFDYGGGPVVPGAATGGLVVPGGIQHFAAGGVVLPFRPRGTDTVPAMLTPGEIVLNAAQQGRIAGAMGGAQVGAINVTVYPAAGEDEQQLAARVVSALRTNSVLYEAVSVVSKRAVA